MKATENSFTISGFIAKDAEVRQFTNASKASFGLGIPRKVVKKEENTTTSTDLVAFLNIELWRDNNATEDFELLKKGANVTVSGYFYVDSYTDKEGKSRTVVVYRAKNVSPTPDKAEPAEQQSTKAAPAKEVAKA